MYVKLSFTILPFVTCAALIRMKVMFQITHYRLNRNSCVRGYRVYGNWWGPGPGVRKGAKWWTWSIRCSCYYHVARPFVTGRLSIRDYKSISTLWQSVWLRETTRDYVVVKKNGDTIGYLPQDISRPYSLLLRRSSTCKGWTHVLKLLYFFVVKNVRVFNFCHS